MYQRFQSYGTLFFRIFYLPPDEDAVEDENSISTSLKSQGDSSSRGRTDVLLVKLLPQLVEFRGPVDTERNCYGMKVMVFENERLFKIQQLQHLRGHVRNKRRDAFDLIVNASEFRQIRNVVEDTSQFFPITREPEVRIAILRS